MLPAEHYISAVEAIVQACELRDPYTAAHGRRVSAIACAIGREMALKDDRVEGLRLGGMIHDVGKLATPMRILAKPGRLTAEEYEIVRRHPEDGAAVTRPIAFPWPVTEIVAQHHERLDGSGYPAGLVGDQIVLEARIVAVADVLESMAWDRPYRTGLGVDAALAELRDGRGARFEDAAVTACEKMAFLKTFPI